MASLIIKGNRRALQFRLRPNLERQTISLGATTEEDAEVIRKRVTILVESFRADSPPDPSTREWVAKLTDALHAKLAATGLVIPRAGTEAPRVPTLGRFLTEYVGKRSDVKRSTATFYGHTKRCLVEFFGATRPLDKITAGDADDFRRWLVSDQGLADNTVRRRCCAAKQFFRNALRRRLITENPFGDMKGCSVQENRERDYFITRADAQKVIDACPDAQWRLLFALSRFGGLRCPSEHLGLRWGDVDWERSRITIHSPKTEHHKGKASRVIPLFPELRPYLDEVWRQADMPGAAAPVIARYRNDGDNPANLGTQLTKIIRRAGLEPWAKLWQNLRATRATELVAAGWPEYKVCEWLGHTEAVAKKHYWQVTEEDYRQAAGLPAADEALQIALQIPGATGCNPVKRHSRAIDRSLDGSQSCIKTHDIAGYPKTSLVGVTGLEPVTSSV